MAKTSIQWTDFSWNPTQGCTRVSPGCVNCYAEIMAARFSKTKEELTAAFLAKKPGEMPPVFKDQWGCGFAEMKGGDHRWTGKVELIESKLTEPLGWKAPRRVFVNSTSDLFHEGLPVEALDRVFAVMALCPQHTFQVLTKRPARMREYASNVSPLRNVWLGVSVEDQERADERIPHLVETPAAVRFLSCEPLLGPLDLSRWLLPLDWVIVGGESGPNARTMQETWAESLRDQCRFANVPFFMKQMTRNAPIPPSLLVRQFPHAPALLTDAS